ncbi:hypothetical protein RvY_01880 [Ramazzottius varieornatus]|uniref:Uncharacterized protein n=1 Tax=Ramazzottius varieornatus TaxID=947166 RepID=A0A1D1ULA5_RAMVA|nr:hypothetical protein RvY_01880 [Ramazzottius varieornatus]
MYLDDGITRDHLKGEYLYIRLDMQNNVVRSRLLHSASTYTTRVWLERVQVVGFRSKPSSATVKDVTSGGVTSLEFSYNSKLQLLTLRKTGVSMASEWEITISP